VAKSRLIRRREVAIASLKALITSASLAGVLSGWMALSTLGQPTAGTAPATPLSQTAPALEDATRTPDSEVKPSQPTLPDQSIIQPRPRVRTHSSR
jgi:hypothetical protein